MKHSFLRARASSRYSAAFFGALIVAMLAVPTPSHSAFASEVEDVFDRVKHGYADSGGVKIHYALLGPTSGSGNAPLIVMIHGFPDFWYSWRHQMAVLSEDYQVVAIDQRGYNLSDKPKGKEKYDMSLLVDDVRAVVKHLRRDRAVIVGHDWGGRVAWGFAMKYPEMTHRLIVCNLPHPRGIAYERAHNKEQQANTAYAQRFKQEDAAKILTAEGLAARIKDPKERAHYVEAFRRSDFEAMLNYYKQNYPAPPYLEDTSPVVKVKPPVLLIHGLEDRALMHGALNHTWEWLEKDLTLVTIPGVGHFVQNDAAEFVSAMMKSWLELQSAKP
ncbi:MAG: alpha/beta hydrolase [Blastocatellia bacterium]